MATEIADNSHRLLKLCGKDLPSFMEYFLPMLLAKTALMKVNTHGYHRAFPGLNP